MHILGGGVGISQTQEKAENANGYVCSNPACHRTFARPLKTVIVGTSAKPFDACPYCSTEITNTTATFNLGPNPATVESPRVQIEKKTVAAANPVSCNRHFGYLSERGPKDQIPDDCLTCMEIMQCMLKKATDHADT